MTESPSREQVQASLGLAVSQGTINAEQAKDALEQLDDMALGGCAGVDPDDIDSEEVTLVSVVLDESGSMYSHREAVIEAFNEWFLKPIQGARNAESILVSAWTFSDMDGKDAVRLLHGYTPVPDCPKLTKSKYKPDGGTPLFEAIHHTLTGMIAYAATLADAGTRTKCIVIVLSDGWENASKRGITDMKVKRLSESALAQETFVLSYVYFGYEADGDQHAEKVGFPKRHRLTANKSDAEIRRVFGTMSASVISTSQTQVSATALSAHAFFASTP